MFKFIPLAALTMVAAPALAFSCNFSSECYESEACTPTDFTIEVEINDEIISTDFGDLTIVAVKESEALITLFATGAGSEYLLSVTPGAARMSSHINEGPIMVGYLGTCEGAF